MEIIKKVASKIQYHIVPVIIIWIVGLIFIRENSSIRVVGDEFGYWAAGAWLAGYDWSEVASNNAYYGYGYGIILSLIMRLVENPLLQYRIAIVINVVMLTCVYIIIYKLIYKMKLWDKGYVGACVALLLTLYTGNIFHTQFTMTETLLLLGFWSLLLLLYSIYEKADLYKIFIFILLLAYFFAVHQRMIGVFIAGIISLVYILIKNKHWKQLIMSVVMSCAFLLVAVLVKKIYLETYLVYVNDNIADANDFAGQLSKVMQIFSIEGMRLLLSGLVGKIFYISSSSYLLCLVGIYEIVRSIIKAITDRKISYKEYIGFFCLLSTIMLVGISTVFLLNYQNRFDLLIYGRYIELVVSPLMLFGVFALLNGESKNIKMHLSVVLIYLILAMVVNHFIPMEAPLDASHMNCTGINMILKLSSNNVYAVGINSIFIYILVVLIMIVLSNRNVRFAIVSTCIILGAHWLISYFYTYQEGTLSWSVTGCTSKEQQVELIKELGIQNNLYYYVSSNNFSMDFLQFLLGDATLHCIHDESEIENIPKDAYLVTDYASVLNEKKLQNSYKQISTFPYRLWKPKEEYEKVSEYENIQMDNFEIGFQLYLEDYPKTSEPVQILRKWNNWQSEMSYLIQMDDKNFAIIFSKTGSDTEGIWIDISMLDVGKWQQVVITFEKGFVKVFVDNELKTSKSLSIDEVYSSEHLPVIGEHLKDSIKEAYISPVSEKNLNDEFPSFVKENLIVISATSSLIDTGEGVRLVNGSYIELKNGPVSSEKFEIGMQIYLDQYPVQKSLISILTKYIYWQNEMSYVIGMDDANLAVIFSGTGSDSEGIWLENSFLELKKWNDLKITFDKGLVKIFINGTLVKERQLTINAIYTSEISSIAGGNLEGAIKGLYIK